MSGPVTLPTGAMPGSAMPTNAMPASAMPANAMPTSAMPTGESSLDEALAGVLTALIARAHTGEHTDTADAAHAPAARPQALDCGGGSGRRAVPLAVGGADVTVIDSSIDALAILDRRAAEAGVGDHVRGIQADVEDIDSLVPPGSFDLVLLHEVLGSAKDSADVIVAAARTVGPAGYLSTVLANPVAAVIARALSGELNAALAELDVQEDADRRPLDLHTLGQLVDAAGFDVLSTRGLGALSSLVPGGVLDGRPGAARALMELDRRCSARSPYREIAGHLHLLARRR